MPDPDLLAHLRDEAFPAMCAADPSAQRADVLRALIMLTAAQVAAGRGLALDGVSGPERVVEAGRKRLAEVDFGGVDARLPGLLYADLLADRHARGGYYTPGALARLTARLTLDPLRAAGVTHPTVLDPAMGAGHFLIAAAETLAGDASPAARWETVGRLAGVERDPFAAGLARVSLWLWAGHPDGSPGDLTGLLCADALLDGDLAARLPERIDAVVGNPPFASVFTRARADANLRAALRDRYATAVGSFDLAVPFVERAVTLCREGGRVGLVLPNKLLAADYAATLREWLAERVSVETIVDVTGSSPFQAGVYPVVLVLARRTPPVDGPLVIYQTADGRNDPVRLRRGMQSDLRGAPGGVWSGSLDPAWDVLRRCLPGTVPLGEVAALSAGLTVGEAYDLRPRVVDAGPGPLSPDAVRLLTSGLIRRHTTLWGRKDASYLKRRYVRPFVMLGALPARRRAHACAEKLIVAGLGRRPQVVHDRGMAQASVSTVVILEAEWPLGALCAVLNSALVARLYRALFGGLALSGGYLRFGQRELSLLPLPDIPAGDARITRLSALAAQYTRADALIRTDLDAEIDPLVCDLYGLDPADLDGQLFPAAE